MNKEQNLRRIFSIMSEFMEVQISGKAVIIMDLFGHINQVRISVHIPEWKKEHDNSVEFKAYYDNNDEMAKFETECALFLKTFKLLNNGITTIQDVQQG
jgi:uncharacterized protein YchJ